VLERLDDCFLNAFLSEIEVAEAAHQARVEAAGMLAKYRCKLDRL
jgi:hypothetical protein